MDSRTNPMRMLDSIGVEYIVHDYTSTGAISGLEVAEALNQNPDAVCKTLITIGKSGKYYAFVIPVNRTLDLKKAAFTFKEKSVSMIPSKDLLDITGYVHGGCSPLCFKRRIPCCIDSSVLNKNKIMVSAGRIGLQIELNVNDLIKAGSMVTSDISRIP